MACTVEYEEKLLRPALQQTITILYQDEGLALGPSLVLRM